MNLTEVGIATKIETATATFRNLIYHKAQSQLRDYFGNIKTAIRNSVTPQLRYLLLIGIIEFSSKREMYGRQVSS